MTKSEFGEWKRSPVTQEIHSAYRARMEALTDYLIDITNSGDPREVAETAAAIKVYREILNMEGPDGD